MDLEDQQRFTFKGYPDPEIWLTCNRCPWTGAVDLGDTLAELNQRADEHTEVCR